MEKKMVRPYMTAEARDALDNMHEICECETRSESIVNYHMMNYAVCKRNVELEKDIEKERKKNQEWKVYCAVIACTTIASLVALVIQSA